MKILPVIRKTFGICIACSGLYFSSAYTQEQASINFRNAEINSLIESVAEITGRSFVVDPRVRGNVTIIAPETISADMLYQAFLSALQVQGFQAIDDGEVVRIVPFNQAFGLLGGGGDNELETRLIRVNYVDAASLVPVLRPVLSSNARIQAFAQSNYLIVSDIRSNVTELVRMIEEMDDPSQAEIEVINLEHIPAGEAVFIVSQLRQVQEQGLSIVEDALNNRIIVSGPSNLRVGLRNMLRNLDVPTSRQAGVDVVYLSYARGQDLKPVLDGMLQSNSFLLAAGESGEESTYRIEVDEANNALVIAATPAVIRAVRGIIEQLDIIRPQVLIEAVIAEVSEDQAMRLSTQLAYVDRENGGYITRFDNLLTTIIGVGTGDLGADAANAALQQLQGGAILGGDFDLDDGDAFGLIVQALKTDARTQVLSTPSILTLNNEEAYISIGSEVPFITGSFTSSNNSATNPFQTITREEVGIKLRVRPQISRGTAVRLSLEQESSKLISSAQQLGTADVVTSISTITTNVMVEDGQLLVLGGLIDNQSSATESRVPLLGSIPILGHLFRSRANSDEQGILMMFIRPTIIRDPQTASEISAQQFEFLRSYELGRGVQPAPVIGEDGELEEGDAQNSFNIRLDQIQPPVSP